MYSGQSNNTTDAVSNFTLLNCNQDGIRRIFYIEDPELKSIQIINAVFLLVVNIPSGLIAAFGNGLVLLTIINSKALKGPTYILTATLSILDFLVGLLVQGIFLGSAAYPIFKNKTACSIWVWVYLNLAQVLTRNSLSVLALISVERLCAVAFALKYRSLVTKFRTCVAIGCVLSFNIFKDVIGKFIGIPTKISTVLLSLGLAVDFGVMIICYVVIGIILKLKKGQFANKAATEITKTLLMASVACGFCWIPFILSMVLFKRTNPTNPIDLIYIRSWMNTLVMVNSAFNVALYNHRNTVMRREIKLQAERIIAKFLGWFIEKTRSRT